MCRPRSEDPNSGLSWVISRLVLCCEKTCLSKQTISFQTWRVDNQIWWSWAGSWWQDLIGRQELITIMLVMWLTGWARNRSGLQNYICVIFTPSLVAQVLCGPITAHQHWPITAHIFRRPRPEFQYVVPGPSALQNGPGQKLRNKWHSCWKNLTLVKDYSFHNLKDRLLVKIHFTVNGQAEQICYLSCSSMLRF